MSIMSEIKEIVLKKCKEREKSDFDTLADSDIIEILEECNRKGIHISKELLKLLCLN